MRHQGVLEKAIVARIKAALNSVPASSSESATARVWAWAATRTFMGRFTGGTSRSK